MPARGGVDLGVPNTCWLRAKTARYAQKRQPTLLEVARMPTSRPESIENRWDILYRDYPEVYDEFASVPTVGGVDVLAMFDFNGKVVIDVGSGSGFSSFMLAAAATEVIGVEIEDAMRQLAEASAVDSGYENVRFTKGDARSIPLPDSSADVVAAWTLAIYPAAGYRAFIQEAQRVVKTGGLIVSVQVAPGWYGGELNDVIGHETPELDEMDRIFVDEFGFEYEDIEFVQDFGSVDKAIRTYGFIFGRRAIEFMKEHGMTSIRRRDRVHFKRVGP
jgi:ubiquinone/menaquinone biosynthesis C-methylase UbiE